MLPWDNWSRLQLTQRTEFLPQYNLSLNVYPGMNEYTELGGWEETWRWCHLGCMQVRLYFQGRLLAEREWNTKRISLINCFYFQNLSNLVRKLGRYPVRLPACEAQCLKKRPLYFCATCLVDGYFSLHGNVLEHCTTDSCFLRLGAYCWFVGIHLALYERSWGVFNHDPLSAASAKAQDFCELCVERGCFEASACVSQTVWGEGACIWICCLVNWGTGWGNMHVGKYFLCAFLSSRGFLTSVPVGYGAAQRSCTWVSSCEHTSEGPLKKKGGEIENRSNVSKVCWCSVEINHRQSESQAL